MQMLGLVTRLDLFRLYLLRYARFMPAIEGGLSASQAAPRRQAPHGLWGRLAPVSRHCLRGR